MKRILALIPGLVVLLAGCGGGGNVRPASLPPVPAEPFDAIGASIQRSNDGPSTVRVAAYLGVHASGGPWQAGPDYTWTHAPGLVRFESPPTVRIATGASDRERAITAYAVALINRALPHPQHLTIGPDAPAGFAGQWEQGLPNIPDGQMFVEFIGAAPQGGRPGSEALAHQDVETEYDAQQGRWEKKRLRATAVEMDSEFFRSRPDYQAVSVLVHEMLHSLGLAGHVPGDTLLQSWNAGTTPGALGTGTQWHTGALGYTIAVGGNYLRSTGGDAGTVNGQFYGTGHEGVAGSVERDDLTASFGARREQ